MVQESGWEHHLVGEIMLCARMTREGVRSFAVLPPDRVVQGHITAEESENLLQY